MAEKVGATHHLEYGQYAVLPDGRFNLGIWIQQPLVYQRIKLG